ncbi:MAG TPA: hypothetical protein VHR88_02945 [Solirubrobacteraceae bacterium]|nr:hypothetical protein [Solirubrobacteraceae bacterium]
MASTVEPPLRTCRTCGNVERNLHYRCTNCGNDYGAPPPRFSRRALITAAAVAGVVVVAALAVAIVLLLNTKSEDQARHSAAQRELVAQQAAKLRAQERPVAGRLTVARDPLPAPAARRLQVRKAELAAFQVAITQDARHRIAEGRLQGAVRETLCSNIERGISRGEELDLGIRIGRYDCVAVQSDVIKNGQIVGHLGYDYFGALDFTTGGYVLCQGVPSQSEAGRALAVTLLPRACLNAHGERLKGGFISDARDIRVPLPLLGAAGRGVTRSATPPSR